MVTLALDIGGTRMKLALLADGKIIKEGIVESYRDDKYQKNLDKAEAEGRRLMAEAGIEKIDGLGIAFPGLVNPRKKVVVSAFSIRSEPINFKIMELIQLMLISS